ncbi:uncharacterized protein BDR25DRAFT_301642 [Lindgomyces ingoldianus]|uniref:Uncharacterized protein n=1 Tax=Lindgomyces ingoldianus TaxID=673940 RepID=A0ACB6R4H6_9PLEO|nr:uncharacterized protein BDR25DRAFT_301642 [Lindgomyces ingoldianus]KAF2474198.1 hypothetical protein BDR25DRAFT_301642 [Lindgomyces ingoldianus]
MSSAGVIHIETSAQTKRNSAHRPLSAHPSPSLLQPTTLISKATQPADKMRAKWRKKRVRRLKRKRRKTRARSK